MFHGRPRGMVVGGELITWHGVASMVRRSKIEHHVFECCFSARLYAYGLDEDRVSAIRGIIDAEIGFYDAACKVACVLRGSDVGSAITMRPTSTSPTRGSRTRITMA